MSKARIFWLAPEEGGRTNKVPSPYYPIMQDVNNDWWSLMIEHVLGDIYNVRPLAAAAPLNLLSANTELRLFEGSKWVGIGKVIE